MSPGPQLGSRAVRSPDRPGGSFAPRTLPSAKEMPLLAALGHGTDGLWALRSSDSASWEEPSLTQVISTQGMENVTLRSYVTSWKCREDKQAGQLCHLDCGGRQASEASPEGSPAPTGPVLWDASTYPPPAHFLGQGALVEWTTATSLAGAGKNSFLQ